MTEKLDHDEAFELLGAYAVHAIADDERAAVDAHLLLCEACRAEVDDLLGSAALLGTTAPVQAPDLWNRIASEIQRTETPPPLLLEAPKPQLWRRPVPAAAAVAAAVALVFAGVAGDRALRTGDDEAPPITQLAQRLSGTPGAKSVTMRSGDAAYSVQVVMAADGTGYIYDGNLPKVNDDRTYQLWAVVNGVAVSAGVLGPQPHDSAFTVHGDVAAFAITEERAGGVVSSEKTPIVLGAMA